MAGIIIDDLSAKIDEQHKVCEEKYKVNDVIFDRIEDRLNNESNKYINDAQGKFNEFALNELKISFEFILRN